jgi:alkylated DNA repair dioxygenase AlkB
LSVDQQRALVERCRAIMDAPAGGYVPTVRGGGKMHVRMVCLGRHWNALTYTYESTRSDYDDAPVVPVPEAWVQLASSAAGRSRFHLRPDLCIMNWYDADGRMGLHQDKDEGRESIDAGLPVVSISLGDTARFLLWRHQAARSDSVAAVGIRRYVRVRWRARCAITGCHGLFRLPRPPELGIEGRFNLTFRKY